MATNVAGEDGRAVLSDSRSVTAVSGVVLEALLDVSGYIPGSDGGSDYKSRKLAVLTTHSAATAGTIAVAPLCKSEAIYRQRIC